MQKEKKYYENIITTSFTFDIVSLLFFCCHFLDLAIFGIANVSFLKNIRWFFLLQFSSFHFILNCLIQFIFHFTQYFHSSFIFFLLYFLPPVPLHIFTRYVPNHKVKIHKWYQPYIAMNATRENNFKTWRFIAHFHSFYFLSLKMFVYVFTAYFPLPILMVHIHLCIWSDIYLNFNFSIHLFNSKITFFLLFLLLFFNVFLFFYFNSFLSIASNAVGMRRGSILLCYFYL